MFFSPVPSSSDHLIFAETLQIGLYLLTFMFWKHMLRFKKILKVFLSQRNVKK